MIENEALRNGGDTSSKTSSFEELTGLLVTKEILEILAAVAE